jgi:hypothetical protein
MKSSLAQVFRDLAKGQTSCDRIFSHRTTVRRIADELGNTLSADSVLVVSPYDEHFGHNELTSTLLVNQDLRIEYEQLLRDINTAEEDLIQKLKQSSKSRKDLRDEIVMAFNAKPNGLVSALHTIRQTIVSQGCPDLSFVDYDTLFDDKVLEFLRRPDVAATIDNYLRRFNALMESSQYFRKNTFTFHNAAAVAKTLADNGFFKAEHAIRLRAANAVEIHDAKELENLIAEEKAQLTADKQLQQTFSSLEKLITKNASVRALQTYVTDHPELLPMLSDIDNLRRMVWMAYCRQHEPQLIEVLERDQSARSRRAEIEIAASQQRTQWEEVIEIFNSRFFVPFTLEAQNRTAVVLGEHKLISLGFSFTDAGGTAQVDKPKLLSALSTGEKKALYILNVIFEIETRIKTGRETLIVVDDIADSFDYRNKYAIIQYLNDIAQRPNFKQVILTHNFDFFRTLESRFVAYSHCLIAFKDPTGIVLKRAAGIKNVFVNDWKSNFFVDTMKRIASIPFIRNLVEYTSGEASPDYHKLTSLLHWKTDTTGITLADLDVIFNNVFHQNGASSDPTRRVHEMITELAGQCLTSPSGINFENKIVLAIATRLAAERFMIRLIKDSKFCATIGHNQTVKLLRRFKRDNLGTAEIQKTLDSVVLMTPENIHLNSFMYEPILDMSDEHLRRLYDEVRQLR